MIHIATVHWKDERWIDVQQRQFVANLGEPYRVYGFLNGIDNSYRDRFFYSSTEPIASHPVKLNVLADIIVNQAENEDDLIVFIDGDAFPIANVSDYARRKLEEFPLLAVQRRENNGDIQPHPCFCVTTVGFWSRIGGDWKSGYRWLNSSGKETTDVGGNLLQILNSVQKPWYPMLRSNAKDLHPLWFGVYDNVVYHHGAGFRNPISRLDVRNIRDNASWLFRVLDKHLPGAESRSYSNELPRPTLLRRLIGLNRAFWRMHRQAQERNRRLSEDVFRQIQQGEGFLRMLLEGDDLYSHEMHSMR